MRITVWGKHPEHGDFVSAGEATGALPLFEQWLHDNVDELRLARATPSFAPLCFAIPLAESRFVGLLVPSADSVGREFPLATFVELDDESNGVPYSCLPAFLGDWLTRAATLLWQHRQAGLEQLVHGLRALPGPHPADAARAFVLCREALEQPLSDLLEAFEFVGPHAPHYAVQTLISACAACRTNFAPPGRITLSCPVRGQTDVLAWLEATRRLMDCERRPVASFFWPAQLGREPATRRAWSDANARPHLYVSLGDAPPTLLLAVVDSEYESDGIWPLQTRSEHAPGAAARELPITVLRAIEADEPLCAVLALTGAPHA